MEMTLPNLNKAGMATFPPPFHTSFTGFDRCRRECGHGFFKFKYRGFITLSCGIGWGAAQSNFILSSAFRKFCSFEYAIDSTGDWKRDRIGLSNEVSMLDKLPTIFLAGPFFWMSFFGRQENEKDLQTARVEAGGSLQCPEHPSGGRVCTNVLLGLNILAYVAQIASQGKLMLWGAKVNSLIDQGQIWRLVTSSLLHANIGHLLVNCYSLNSIGPTMEKLSGPKRFLTIYMASAVASSTMSYYFCKAPAVGASGAIFGLAGSLAVFLMRHNSLMSGGQHSLSVVAQVIAMNMVLGLASPDIDNWGHMGGLIGGAALSWFLGPALSFESTHGGMRRVLTDRPPVSYLMGWGRRRMR